MAKNLSLYITHPKLVLKLFKTVAWDLNKEFSAQGFDFAFQTKKQSYPDPTLELITTAPCSSIDELKFLNSYSQVASSYFEKNRRALRNSLGKKYPAYKEMYFTQLNNIYNKQITDTLEKLKFLPSEELSQTLAYIEDLYALSEDKKSHLLYLLPPSYYDSEYKVSNKKVFSPIINIILSNITQCVSSLGLHDEYFIEHTYAAVTEHFLNEKTFCRIFDEKALRQIIIERLLDKYGSAIHTNAGDLLVYDSFLKNYIDWGKFEDIQLNDPNKDSNSILHKETQTLKFLVSNAVNILIENSALENKSPKENKSLSKAVEMSRNIDLHNYFTSHKVLEAKVMKVLDKIDNNEEDVPKFVMFYRATYLFFKHLSLVRQSIGMVINSFKKTAQLTSLFRPMFEQTLPSLSALQMYKLVNYSKISFKQLMEQLPDAEKKTMSTILEKISTQDLGRLLSGIAVVELSSRVEGDLLQKNIMVPKVAASTRKNKI